MVEEKKDANTEVIEDDNEIMDNILDAHEASSASKMDAEGNDAQDTGVDQSKKANLEKETEAESGPEAKLAKIKEILGDDEKAIDAYIKSRGYHTDPAWQKLLAKSKTPAIDEETQKQLDEFKKVTASREYIETKMGSEGYKQGAIDAELKRRGFDIQPKGQDDVELVMQSLGLDPKALNDNTKATIADVSKVVDIILKDRLGKTLPDKLKPFEENLTAINRRENAAEITKKMRGFVETEGVLDFAKDINPALQEFLEKNPKATQEDVYDYFLQINHSLSIERLKTGKKRADNQDVKDTLRKSARSAINLGTLPKKTGDFNADADAILDSLGVQ